MNMYLINMQGKYGAIDTDDSSCHGCYIIKFSSSPYIFQEYFSIYGQFILSFDILCEGTYFFLVNINYHYYALQKIH